VRIPSTQVLQALLGGWGRFYSYLNASTGFLVAALQLCQLTVSKAIPNANKPARAKIHQLIAVL
jgi:hypothetical protein